MKPPTIPAKGERYEELLSQLSGILQQEDDPVAWMATAACLLKERFGFLWVGFYRVVGEELRVGPYQGTLGCLRIPFGSGVCGSCARQQRTIVVPDVHDFPGHITCDVRARSEIVVPVHSRDGALRAVLDVDSDQEAAFDGVDQRYLEVLAEQMKDLQWDRLS